MDSDEEVLQRILKLNEDEFEGLLGQLYDELGYAVEYTKPSGDRGIDLRATRNWLYNETHLVQAKRYSESNTVGSGKVRKVAGLHPTNSDADVVALITTSSFTDQAEEAAADGNVKLVSGEKLALYIRQSGLSDALNEYLEEVPRTKGQKQERLREVLYRSSEKDSDATVILTHDEKRRVIIMVRESPQIYYTFSDVTDTEARLIDDLVDRYETATTSPSRGTMTVTFSNSKIDEQLDFVSEVLHEALDYTYENITFAFAGNEPWTDIGV